MIQGISEVMSNFVRSTVLLSTTLVLSVLTMTAQAATECPAISIATALVHNYPFEDGADQVNDVEGNSDGVAMGAMSTGVSIGSALSLNEDSVVTIPGFTVDTSRGLPVSLRVNPESIDNESRYISQATGVSSSSHNLMIGSLYGALRVRLMTGTGTVTLILEMPTLPGVPVLRAGAWNHVVMTYDNVTLKLYIDGVEMARTGNTGLGKVLAGVATALGNQLPGAGREDRAMRSLVGQLDEVRVYSAALTASDVAFLSNRTAPCTGADMGDGGDGGEGGEGSAIECLAVLEDKAMVLMDQIAALQATIVGIAGGNGEQGPQGPQGPAGADTLSALTCGVGQIARVINNIGGGEWGCTDDSDTYSDPHDVASALELLYCGPGEELM